MTIRDSHAAIDGSPVVYTMPSGGLEVVGADGRALFCITRAGDGIQISAAGCVKASDGTILAESLLIHPKVSNVVEVHRKPYA